MNSLSNISRKVAVAMILLLLVAGSGCKSKKKAMEAAAAEKARMEQEAALKKQKEEDERKRQEEQARQAEEERVRKEKEAQASRQATPSMQLEDYFNAIATSATPASANGTIQQALTLFANDEVPVLIVISESGGEKDYDRPTNIKSYLNYLKDVKKNPNRVSNLQFNNSNKIVEVELMKNR